MQRVLFLTDFKDEDLIRRNAMLHQSVTVRRLTSYYAAWTGTKVIVEHIAAQDKLADFDVVYIQGWLSDPTLSHVMALWLEWRGIPFIGRTLSGVNSTSKLSDMVRLVQVGLPYPKTFYASRPQNLPDLFAWANQSNDLCFPLIVKHVAASCGNRNYRITDMPSLHALSERIKGHYLMQEYIPNSYDYRVLIVGGEIGVIIKRQRESDETHLNNTSKGAQATVLEIGDIDKRILDIARAAAFTLGRSDIAGVDIVVSSESKLPYVLEVNRCPMVTGGVAENIDIGKKLAAVFQYADTLGARRQEIREAKGRRRNNRRKSKLF